MKERKILKQAAVVTGFFCAALAVKPAWAQEVDPGLWEFRMEMNSLDRSGPMAQMQEQLKNMPPEMQQMMKQQMESMGMRVDGGGSTVTVKHCVTPEEAKKGPIREGQTDGDCTYTQVKQKGKTWSGHMACSEGDLEGDFTATQHSRRHHSTEANMTGSDTGRMVFKSEARWLAADCGEQGR